MNNEERVCEWEEGEEEAPTDASTLVTVRRVVTGSSVKPQRTWSRRIPMVGGFLPLGRFTGNRRQLRAREGFTVDRNAPNYGHSTRIYPCALILLQYDLKITISCTHYNRRRILCIALAFQGVIVVKLHSYSTNIWVLACKTGTKSVGPTGVSARWLRKW